jgi:hypothetical protein
LLFAHDKHPFPASCAAKRPGNETATSKTKPAAPTNGLEPSQGSSPECKNGQARARPFAAKNPFETNGRYFAAVGNGTGLSAKVCK